MNSTPTARTTRLQGTILRLIPDRGFFFIKGEDGGEYFAHLSALENCRIDALQPQQTVSFVPTKTPKGLRAEEVRRG